MTVQNIAHELAKSFAEAVQREENADRQHIEKIMSEHNICFKKYSDRMEELAQRRFETMETLELILKKETETRDEYERAVMNLNSQLLAYKNTKVNKLTPASSPVPDDVLI